MQISKFCFVTPALFELGGGRFGKFLFFQFSKGGVFVVKMETLAHYLQLSGSVQNFENAKFYRFNVVVTRII